MMPPQTRNQAPQPKPRVTPANAATRASPESSRLGLDVVPGTVIQLCEIAPASWIIFKYDPPNRTTTSRSIGTLAPDPVGQHFEVLAHVLQDRRFSGQRKAQTSFVWLQFPGLALGACGNKIGDL